MSIVNTSKSSSLKALTMNEVEGGEFKVRSKTYNNVRTEASDDAVYNTYKHITGIQEDTPVECQRISVNLLTEE